MIQCSALVAVGLLHAGGGGSPAMLEAFTNEVLQPRLGGAGGAGGAGDVRSPGTSHDVENYTLSAGFALGLMCLGKGREGAVCSVDRLLNGVQGGVAAEAGGSRFWNCWSSSRTMIE